MLFEQGEEISKQMIDWVGDVAPESYVKVRGTVVKQEVLSCSVKDFEINGYQIFTLNKSESKLPIQVDKSKLSEANLDTILNHRVLDLRSSPSFEIMKIRSDLLWNFTNVLYENSFT